MELAEFMLWPRDFHICGLCYAYRPKRANVIVWVLPALGIGKHICGMFFSRS